MKNINKMLPKEVAAKFEVINWKGGSRQVFGKRFGLIDLTTLTEQKATALVNAGFYKLVKKKQSSQKTPEK